MAMDLSPSHWLDGYSSTSSALTIPLSALPGLDASEADADAGDIRKVWRALCAAMHEAWLAEPAGDRPAKMQLARSSYTDESTGAQRRTYQAQFSVVVAEEEVASEEGA